MSKIALSGNPSGTGTFTIASPNSNTDRTLTLPDNTGTVLTSVSSLAAANLTGRVPAASVNLGGVVQVVSTTKTDTFSTSSSSFTDITGVSVSITPSSASSRIMVFALVYVGGPVSDSGQAMTRLMRDSTAIAIGDASGSRTQAGSESGFATTFYMAPAVHTFLDSPATTSAVTYKVQMRVTGSTFFVNRTGADADATFESRVVSTITVMEIAA